jgi:hypothetical protein
MTIETTKEPLRISLRLTKEESSRLLEDARGATVSNHVRSCLFGTKGRSIEGRGRNADDVALAKLLAELGQSELASSLRSIRPATRAKRPSNRT